MLFTKGVCTVCVRTCTVFLTLLFAVVSLSGATAQNTKAKENTAKPKKDSALKSFETDPLIERPLLYREDIYPREYIGPHAEWVEQNKSPMDFDYKFYAKIGYPVFPGLFPDGGKGVMEQAGMDLFSGDIYLGGGAQMRAGDSAVLQAEVFYVSFTSGEGAGLARLSNGNLSGTTSLSGFGASASYLYYLMDYLFLGVGGGIWLQNFSVEYIKKDVFIDLQSKTLEDNSFRSTAPLAILTLGADIPIYREVRALWNLDYQMAFYKKGLGDFLTFSFSVAYLM